MFQRRGGKLKGEKGGGKTVLEQSEKLLSRKGCFPAGSL